LRAGAVSLEELKGVAPNTRSLIRTPSEPIRSPGLNHRHYKPAAEVKMISESDRIDIAENAAYIGIHDRVGPFKLKKLCSSTNEYAHELFRFFRQCDRQKIRVIYCEAIPETGIGMAIMDRLRRASLN
jgi:L-threonylcarbamoyladenylate synthase